MNINKAFYLPKEARDPQWLLIDASNHILGRLITQVTEKLRGKDKAFYTPHTDSGDHIIIINAEKIVLTGNKWSDKELDRYSGWRGGYKVTKAQDMDPAKLLEHAVAGMLPKNKLSRQIIKKLHVYAGESHPHMAQNPKAIEIKTT